MKKAIPIALVTVIAILLFAGCGAAQPNSTQETALQTMETDSPSVEPTPAIAECPSEIVEFNVGDDGIYLHLRTSYENFQLYMNDKTHMLTDVMVSRSSEEPSWVYMKIDGQHIQQNIPFDIIIEMGGENGVVTETLQISDILLAITKDNDPENEMAITGEGMQVTKAIQSVDDLEKFPDVRHLLLCGGGISGNLDELAGFGQLETLCLDWCRIEGDVPMLSGLKNLGIMSDVRIDLDLSKLPLLEYVNIYGYNTTANYGTKVIDLKQLKGLSNRQTLILVDSSSVIGSLAPLAAYNTLTHLVISGCNEYTDNYFHLSDIADITSLEYLNLPQNIDGDLSSLYELKNLTYISLSPGSRDEITGSESELLRHIHPESGNLFYMELG